jgi:hypothetical protein
MVNLKPSFSPHLFPGTDFFLVKKDPPFSARQPQKPLQKKWFNEGLSLPEILKFLWSGFGHSRLTIKAVQNIRGPKNLSILGSCRI